MLGFLYKHRGAVESPQVELRRPVRTSLALFRSPWYTLGIVVAMAGWGLHVGALALAPISLVQSVIAGGLVLLPVTADRLFAHQVTRREWIGVGLAALGLAFLAATLEGAGLVQAVGQLRKLVTQHVADEEKNLLPALEDAATTEQLEALGARVLQAKQRGG